MAAGISILDWAIYAYIFDGIPGPEWPGIAMVGFEEGSPKSIKHNECKHNESLAFAMTEHNHSDDSDEYEKWIDGHGDDHEVPIQYQIRVSLGRAYNLNADVVEGMPETSVEDECYDNRGVDKLAYE